MKPWYHFTALDVVFAVCFYTASYLVLDLRPTVWFWIIAPPALLFGKWVGWRLFRR